MFPSTLDALCTIYTHVQSLCIYIYVLVKMCTMYVLNAMYKNRFIHQTFRTESFRQHSDRPTPKHVPNLPRTASRYTYIYIYIYTIIS